MVSDEPEVELQATENVELQDENQPKKICTLEILRIIKEAQQQHGLRHGDYQRYRGYCSRKIKRLRKALHIPQGDRRHFRKKDVTEEMVTEEKWLYIPLMLAERAWSYAMQLRQESNTELRKKFHLHSRLRKAATYALQLNTLCQGDKVDARTKLEAQAYVDWIHGSLHFELQMWKPAMENLKKAQVVYEKLAAALSEDDRVVYKQRVEELAPSLRYCAYNVGDETAIDDLLKMRGTGQGDLLANLDTLIAQTRDKRSQELSDVVWRGRTVPVKPDKVRPFLAADQELKEALDRAQDRQAKVTLIENLLMDCKDAIAAVKDELKNDPNFKIRCQSQSGPVSSQHYLLSYLVYIRLTRNVERNLIMVESTKQNLEQDGGEGKKAKPQDLTRLYEIILQNITELKSLAGFEEDAKFQQEIESQVKGYQAFRCYYMAQTLVGLKRWKEAIALFHRAEEYLNQSLTQQAPAPLSAQLKKLKSDIEGQKFSVHANSVLSEDEQTETSTKTYVRQKKPLAERLDEYCEDQALTTKQPNVFKLPPEFEPIPCKPLFFDLAFNHVEFPSLEDKLEQKQQQGAGISGFVKGLWGWGGKK
ncbi:Hypothetical predicted protein [Cloeon dipterum]|uniref:Signal recognition particle subunit SRP68 n=1 Tax=Cloeon dipterum TaxID=197152 RepID=A0A8S1CIZ3_9INSE|nr:Hypothetical predicted protein [Cloeon dipterum]